MSLDATDNVSITARGVPAITITPTSTLMGTELVVPFTTTVGALKTNSIVPDQGVLTVDAEATVVSGDVYVEGGLVADRLDLRTNTIQLAALPVLGRFSVERTEDGLVVFKDGLAYTGGMEIFSRGTASRFVVDLSSPSLLPTDVVTVHGADGTQLGTLSGTPG